MSQPTRDLALLVLTGWRCDAIGNLTLVGGPLGPDVAIDGADLEELQRAVAEGLRRRQEMAR